MLDEMSAAEFASWEAFFSIEPMPEKRADLRAAEIMRSILWAAGAKSVPALSRLVPDWWSERTRARQSPEEIESTFALIKAARPRKRKDVT
jgi:hypothetical protein